MGTNNSLSNVVGLRGTFTKSLCKIDKDKGTSSLLLVVTTEKESQALGRGADGTDPWGKREGSWHGLRMVSKENTEMRWGPGVTKHSITF